MSTTPNSAIPLAQVEEPAQRPRPRGVLYNLGRIATFPALVTLGASALAFEHLQHQLQSGGRTRRARRT
jgi:hypothetical protein